MHPRLPLPDPTVCTGMKACVDAGRLRDADRLLQRMAAAGCPPDVRAYNILLAGHSRAANPTAMGRLLQRMQGAGLAPSAVTWNTLVDGYVRARDLGAAKRCAAQAADAGAALDVWTYSTLIKGYVQVGGKGGWMGAGVHASRHGGFLLRLLPGGAERQPSVAAGLEDCLTQNKLLHSHPFHRPSCQAGGPACGCRRRAG